jgi:hypothetical protein
MLDSSQTERQPMALEEEIIRLLVKIAEKLDQISAKADETNKLLNAIDTTTELTRIQVTDKYDSDD